MRLYLSILVATLALGCQSKEAQKARGGGLTEAAEGTLPEEEKGKVVARVGDETITLEEFEKRLNQQSPFARARYNSLERKREFLDSMVRFELLARQAETKGYGDDPDVVLARKQAMVKLLSANEISELVKITDITDADIEAHYKENIDDYDKPAEVRAAHILVDDEARAKALLAEIQAKTEADPLKARDIFADFARVHSKDDVSKQHGGDLQFFGKPGVNRTKRGPLAPEVPPPVANAAFAIEDVGGLAPAPIKTSKGWHLVQKTGFRRPYRRELADVRNSIRNTLFRARKGKAMEQYVTDLRAKAKVEIDETVLAESKAEPQKGAMPRLAPPPLPPGLGRKVGAGGGGVPKLPRTLRPLPPGKKLPPPPGAPE